MHFGSVAGGSKVDGGQWLTKGFTVNASGNVGYNKGPTDPVFNDHDGSRNDIGADGGRNYVVQGHLEDKAIPLWIDVDPIRVPKGGKITLKSLGVVGE